MRDCDSRSRLQTDAGFRLGRKPSPNKPNGFKFWWVNQINGLRPKQTQVIYLQYRELNTAKFGLFFEKSGMSKLPSS